MNGLFSFQLSQDRDVPMAAILADGHTLGCTDNITALDESHPADLGQVHLIALDLKSLGEPEAVMHAPLFELRHTFILFEAIP